MISIQAKRNGKIHLYLGRMFFKVFLFIRYMSCYAGCRKSTPGVTFYSPNQRDAFLFRSHSLQTIFIISLASIEKVYISVSAMMLS